jgi:hypothetical protein
MRCYISIPKLKDLLLEKELPIPGPKDAARLDIWNISRRRKLESGATMSIRYGNVNTVATGISNLILQRLPANHQVRASAGIGG